VACDLAIDLDIDLIPLGHATLKLLKLYLKRRGAPAMRKHGLGHVIASARVRDVQPPTAKTRRPFVTLLLTVANRGVARAMWAEIFGALHALKNNLKTTASVLTKRGRDGHHVDKYNQIKHVSKNIKRITNPFLGISAASAAIAEA
jgi:hypothetical protein